MNFSVFSVHALILFSATIICITLASILLNHSRFIIITNHHSSNSLDGLRAILALFVLSWHFYLTFIEHSDGQWALQANEALNNHGNIPVSFFFLITGFLFFKKITQDDIDWKALYLSRIKRIVPLYYLAIIPVIFFTAQYNWQHAQDWTEFAKWLKQWLLFYGASFQEFASWKVIAGVQWTLLYEWGFYFSLPLFWWIYHRRTPRPIFVILLLLISYWIWTKTSSQIYKLFLFALPAVYISKKKPIFFQKQSKIIDFLLLLLLIATFWFSKSYQVPQMILLALVFSFISQGYTFFGILSHRGLRVLGTISYSIYLIHGFVLYFLFRLLHIQNFQQLQFQYFIFYLPLIFCITISLSLLTYRFIEYPCLKKR